jgi:hypothetical protein
MAAVRDDPSEGLRDCGMYFHWNVDRVRRIPVNVNDQNVGGNRGKRRGCEVHVIIAVFHGMVLPPQLPELIVPVFMVLSHDLPINVGPDFPDPPAPDSPLPVQESNARRH